MSEWRDVSLGDVLTLQRGFDITKNSQRPGPVPVVSSSGIASFHDEARAKGPGVVIGRKGSLGTTFFMKGPYWPHDTTLWVKDFKGNDPYFCYLLLKTLPLSELDAGSSNPTLNRNHAHLLRVRSVDVVTQRRIAAILFAFDELIETNERRIELLEALARSLYREWFVRFRFPGHDDVELVDSELGPIPAGWTIRSLGDIAHFVGGSTITKAAYVDHGYTAFSAAGPDGFLESFDVDDAGVVLSAVGARCGRTFRASGRWSAIANTIRYVPRPGRACPGWLYLATADPSIWPKRGSAQPFVSINDARAVKVVLPGIETMTSFEHSVDAMFGVVDALIAQNRALAVRRDLVLPRLVTGRLDISDIDLGNLLLAREPV